MENIPEYSESNAPSQYEPGAGRWIMRGSLYNLIRSLFSQILSWISDQPQPKYIEGYIQQTHTALTSGTLVVGQQYVIYALAEFDDFGNVGYQSENSVFVATGTTPTAWTEGTEVHDFLASTPSIVERYNNLGRVTCGISSIGSYSFISEGLFTEGKTSVLLPGFNHDVTANMVFNTEIASEDVIAFKPYAVADAVNSVDLNNLSSLDCYFKITVYP